MIGDRAVPLPQPTWSTDLEVFRHEIDRSSFVFAVTARGAAKVHPWLPSAEVADSVLENVRSRNDFREVTTLGPAHDSRRAHGAHVVVPVYNEESTIRTFLARTEAVLATISERYEILFCMDSSPDRTEQVIAGESSAIGGSS